MTMHTITVESNCGRIFEEFQFGTSAHVPRVGETYESTVSNPGMHYTVMKVSTSYEDAKGTGFNCNIHSRVKVSQE